MVEVSLGEWDEIGGGVGVGGVGWYGMFIGGVEVVEMGEKMGGGVVGEGVERGIR